MDEVVIKGGYAREMELVRQLNQLRKDFNAVAQAHEATLEQNEQFRLENQYLQDRLNAIHIYAKAA